MAIKNQALTVSYYAWDTENSVGKTGDAANHALYVSIDGVANAVDDTSSTEVDATNLPGVYAVDLIAAEMNGNNIMFGGKSSTENIVIIPISITTERGDLAVVDANVDLVLADTNELQTDDVPGLIAVVDANVDLVLADTNELQTDDVPGLIAVVDANVDLVLADTNELQTDDVPGLIAALNDVSVTDLLTTQMTEAYAAGGAAPTLAQALCAIQQFLQERLVVGTTLTVYELDGVTPAMTFTLNSTTAPTGITRAT